MDKKKAFRLAYVVGLVCRQPRGFRLRIACPGAKERWRLRRDLASLLGLPSNSPELKGHAVWIAGRKISLTIPDPDRVPVPLIWVDEFNSWS